MKYLFSAGLIALLPGLAQAVMISNLNFATLPSSQGWSHEERGLHIGVGEGVVFTATGTALQQRTFGLPMGANSPGATVYEYDISGLVAGGHEIFTVEFTAAVSRHEQTRQDFSFAGFEVAVSGNGKSSYVGVKPGEIHLNGIYNTPAGYDGTASHDYKLVLNTSSNVSELFVDGVSEILTTNASSATEIILFGDGSGTTNADADITRFVAYTGLVNPVPVPAAVWLFALGLASLFGVGKHKSSTVRA